MSQYDLSRKKYSSLAIAAICTVLQDIHYDLNNNGAAMEEDQTCELQTIRDNFLIACK